ncbi:MAG: hypothetical protein ABEJ66_01155 [Candidatus Nanohaloarchaea archaeon]
MSVEKVIENSDVLSARLESRAYLEGNRDYWSSMYGGKKVMAVTSGGSSEIAAVYDSGSGRNEMQALEAVEEFFPREAYHSMVARKMEE